MPLCTRAFCKPYLATTGHSSGGASSTLGQPRWTAVSQMRSILHFHSVALRHQYASDCLMRPLVTTRLLLRTGMHYSMRKHTSELRSDAQGGAFLENRPALREDRSLTVAALIGAARVSKRYPDGQRHFPHSLRRPLGVMSNLCHSDPAELGDGFLDGFELLDEGQHGVFGVVQLFGLLENFGGVRLGHNGHAILVGHDDIAGVHASARAGDRNIGAGEAEMIDGGGGRHAAAEYMSLIPI